MSCSVSLLLVLGRCEDGAASALPGGCSPLDKEEDDCAEDEDRDSIGDADDGDDDDDDDGGSDPGSA